MRTDDILFQYIVKHKYIIYYLSFVTVHITHKEIP
jgi:hypothetical protein